MDIKLFKLHDAYGKHIASSHTTDKMPGSGRCACGLYLYYNSLEAGYQLMSGAMGLWLTSVRNPDIKDILAYAAFLKRYPRVMPQFKRQAKASAARPYGWLQKGIVLDAERYLAERKRPGGVVGGAKMAYRIT